MKGYHVARLGQDEVDDEMSNDAVEKAIADPMDDVPARGRAIAKFVMVVLAHHHNGATGLCNPGMSTLATECGTTRRSVIAAIKVLVDYGRLEVEHHFEGRHKARNSYILKPMEAAKKRQPRAPAKRQGSVGPSLGMAPEAPLGDVEPSVGSSLPTCWLDTTPSVGSTHKQEDNRKRTTQRTDPRPAASQPGLDGPPPSGPVLTLIRGNKQANGKHKPGNGASTPFVRPTAAEVDAEALKIGAAVSGVEFVDYYEARGWMLGRTPMKDWRAALRGWKHRADKRARELAADSDPFGSYL